MTRRPHSAPRLMLATGLLAEILMNGPRLGTECMDELRDFGVSRVATTAARRKLGVRSIRRVGDRRRWWSWGPTARYFAQTGAREIRNTRDHSCSSCTRWFEPGEVVYFLPRLVLVAGTNRPRVVRLCADCVTPSDEWRYFTQCSGCPRRIRSLRPREWCSEACRQRGPRPTTTCARCGARLGDDLRRDARYCSTTCRMAGYRARRAARRIAAENTVTTNTITTEDQS